MAVATPSRPNGQIDPAHLFRACSQIATALAKLDRKQIVVIRSSVLPSIFDECRTIFEKIAPGLVELCANPEFLREGTAIRDFEQPPFTILGTDTADAGSHVALALCGSDSPDFRATAERCADGEVCQQRVPCPEGCVRQRNRRRSASHAGVDAEAVMDVFCNDNKLNISRRYLMPGLRLWQDRACRKTCAPILHAGKAFDLQLPLIAAILSSNHYVIGGHMKEFVPQGSGASDWSA